MAPIQKQSYEISDSSVFNSSKSASKRATPYPASNLNKDQTILTTNRPPITILGVLFGESANWLLHIAKVKTIQWRLQERGVSSTIRFRSKWKKKCRPCLNFIETCFSNLKQANYLDYAASQPKIVGRAQANTQDWLKKAVQAANQTVSLRNLNLDPETSEEEEDQLLDSLPRLLRFYEPTYMKELNATLPVIYVSSMLSPRDYDDYYEQLQDLLTFEDGQCCGSKLPGPNDSVFVRIQIMLLCFNISCCSLYLNFFCSTFGDSQSRSPWPGHVSLEEKSCPLSK
jgi:hypothetical protein